METMTNYVSYAPVDEHNPCSADDVTGIRYLFLEIRLMVLNFQLKLHGLVLYIIKVLFSLRNISFPRQYRRQEYRTEFSGISYSLFSLAFFFCWIEKMLVLLYPMAQKEKKRITVVHKYDSQQPWEMGLDGVKLDKQDAALLFPLFVFMQLAGTSVCVWSVIKCASFCGLVNSKALRLAASVDGLWLIQTGQRPSSHICHFMWPSSGLLTRLWSQWKPDLHVLC